LGAVLLLGACSSDGLRNQDINLLAGSAEPRELAETCLSARSSETYDITIGRETALRLTNDGACAFSLFRITDPGGSAAPRGAYESATLTVAPKSGTVSFVTTESATWVEYSPAAGYVGPDRFAFRLLPGGGIFPVQVDVLARSATRVVLRPEPSSVFVHFELNRSELTADGRRALDGMRAVITDPRFAQWKIDLGGHTDASGAEAYNQRLSERRALAVRDYLVDQFGVAASRTATAGYGMAVLIDRARPLDGINRRVHLTLRRGVHTEARPRP